MENPTNKEKMLIRLNWLGLNLKFKKDGTVLAQKTKGGAWGILYTPYNLEQHIKHLRMIADIKEEGSE